MCQKYYETGGQLGQRGHPKCAEDEEGGWRGGGGEEVIQGMWRCNKLICVGVFVGVWVDVLLCVLVVCVGVYMCMCVLCVVCVCVAWCVCVDGGMKGVEQVSLILLSISNAEKARA